MTLQGVIVFGSDQEVKGVMRAVRRNNATGIFTWIGSDGWSARSLVFDGNEDEVEGTLSVQPRAHAVRGFDRYFTALTVDNNPRNPWFTEFWEHFFGCRFPGSLPTPYNGAWTAECSGKEVLSNETGYEAEKQLQFVSDAVLAFGYALRSLHRDACGGKPGLCPRMSPVDGFVLLSYLKNVTFRGLSGDEFQFSENGDGPARYNIIHFKQVAPGNYKWVRVGQYEDGELDIDLSLIRFRLEEPKIPTSVCSQPCLKGQAKKFVDGEKCCWHCFNCTKYQILKSETKCSDCPLGFLPNLERTRCVAIPLQFMQIDSYWAIGAMIFASIGIVITVFVIAVFLRFHDTPIVKASGRELSYVLLGGIFMCYAMTFILIQRPSDVLCGAQKIGIGLCFTIVYSAILTKTNRIARIFRAGARSTKRPNFISPKSQLIICGCIIGVQFLISTIWLVFSPPQAKHYHRTRDDNHLVCAGSVDATYMVAFAYPMILICVCTLYAILTRKIPEAFNESKFIGFTMYTTCIIWLAFIPLYFATAANVEVNVFTMSVTVNLSATVTIFCLFTPKLYIILLHPEKNIRQSLMNQNKHSGTTNHTVTSSTRIDQATISDVNGIEIEMVSLRLPSPEKTRRISCGTQTNNVFLPDAWYVVDSNASTRKVARCMSCNFIYKTKSSQDQVLL